MGRQIIILALVFFTIFRMTLATRKHNDAHALIGDGVIVTTSGGNTDATPVGRPFLTRTFHNLALGPSTSAAIRLEVTIVASAL
ncbi:Hypothetical predicted protein [Olea europaea subsp. europaea]|uniref:Secreted protein n=1 Tax=Olea europaea subsp. europaea TaxID=158383 RepID=A0A8S0SUU5_OLEEU|nr:Hypothetical predicted protein [Olea europaea subsp. europaea]